MAVTATWPIWPRIGSERARPGRAGAGYAECHHRPRDYLPADTPAQWPALELGRLQRPTEAVVSLYARGRDYHKVLRSRLQRLAEQIHAGLGPIGYRVFTDSAPVLEVELAARSGLAWRGKHTLALNRDAGSMFFLGEIFVDMALPATPAQDQVTAAVAVPASMSARRRPSWHPTGSTPGAVSLI